MFEDDIGGGRSHKAKGQKGTFHGTLMYCNRVNKFLVQYNESEIKTGRLRWRNLRT
jgi:hypothetical protein